MRRQPVGGNQHDSRVPWTQRTDLAPPGWARWDGKLRYFRWAAFRGSLMRDAKVVARLPGKRMARIELSVQWFVPEAKS